ncbi:hypothetical protein BC628DRAFT_974440 [Trametes gibbosa]|nr:hypothetical protein BC628DRAFT_974440 [Trametes gibbosa]
MRRLLSWQICGFVRTRHSLARGSADNISETCPDFENTVDTPAMSARLSGTHPGGLFDIVAAAVHDQSLGVKIGFGHSAFAVHNKESRQRLCQRGARWVRVPDRIPEKEETVFATHAGASFFLSLRRRGIRGGRRGRLSSLRRRAYPDRARD